MLKFDLFWVPFVSIFKTFLETLTHALRFEELQKFDFKFDFF